MKINPKKFLFAIFGLSSKNGFEPSVDQEQHLIQHRLPKNIFFQFLLFFTESLVHPVLDSLGNSKINRERMKALAIYLPMKF